MNCDVIGQLTAEVSGPNGAHPFTMEGYGNRFTLSITPQMEGTSNKIHAN